MKLSYRPFAKPTHQGLAALCLMCSAWLWACGGVELGGTGSQPAGFASGPIDGFGSIVVGGVHYDDSLANIADADQARLDRQALRLGMVVEIESDRANATSLTAKASHVRVIQEVLGPVTAREAGGTALTVLGQTVLLTGSTLLDEAWPQGAASIQVGDVVAVYGLRNPATGAIQATRLEPQPNASAFIVQGPITGLDVAKGTVSIYGATLAGVPGAMGELKVGQNLRARLATQANAQGAWPSLQAAPRARAPKAGAVVHVEGVLYAVPSAAGSASSLAWSVDDVPVDFSLLPPNASAQLTAGQRVSVEGRMVSGVLLVEDLDLEDRDDNTNRNNNRTFEIKGTIVSVDQAQRTLVMQPGQQLIDYSSAAFKQGQASDLAAGRKIEVKGRPGAGNTRLIATLIEFDD